MTFLEETKLCAENHRRAQVALEEEEKRIADRNRRHNFQTMEDLIRHQVTPSYDDPTKKNAFTLPHCNIAQGNGGTKKDPSNYQQDFYGVASDPRIAQLTVEQIKQLLYEAFEEVGKLTAGMNSGATFSAAITTADQIITAHIGDTRIIRCHDGKATALTWDHKAESEKERVIAAGGIVTEGGETADGRIKIPRVGGLLAISRAFGNSHIKGKLDTPSLNVQPLAKNDVLVIASDGLWDVVAPSEIAKITNVGLKVVTDLARATAFRRGSSDNCTVLAAENLVANSIYFVGDGHGFDSEKKPLFEAVNTIKEKFLEILDQKINVLLNPAAVKSSTETTIPINSPPISQLSTASVPEHDDDFDEINAAVQSSSTSASATTTTAHVSNSPVNDDDDNVAEPAKKKPKTTDDDNDDEEEDEDDDAKTSSGWTHRRH